VCHELERTSRDIFQADHERRCFGVWKRLRCLLPLDHERVSFLPDAYVFDFAPRNRTASRTQNFDSLLVHPEDEAPPPTDPEKHRPYTEDDEPQRPGRS